MPKSRPCTSSPVPQRLAATLAGACAITLAVLASPAHAQFNGNTGTDLLAPGSSAASTRADEDDTTRNGDATPATGSANPSATTRLQAPAQNRASGIRGSDQPEPRDQRLRPLPYQPNEFERYVATKVMESEGERVERFGNTLLTDPQYASQAQDPLPTVPGDYIVRPGDEIALVIWGSADADLRLTVDRAGRISVPRVGAINVAGLRYAELQDAVRQRVGQVFKNFQLTATMGQVRPIRVLVGGYAVHPGSINVSGLSSVLHVIMRAGGPSAAGSFRDIHLRRNGRDVATFDLYDLLIRGVRDTDQLVQPDDVIFIGPVGPQVAVHGSVNVQAVFELKAGETLADALQMAGGFGAVADRGRVAIERLADRASGHITELALPAHAKDPLVAGDIVRVFSLVATAQPMQHHNERIRIEGEVARPGDYILPPGSRISDALRIAGGMTASGYPYGTELTRQSVRKTQQVNYDRALRDLETDITRGQASQRSASQDELNAQTASITSSQRLIDQLRQVRPTGRIVLQVEPDATALPDLALEDGDTITIPARSSTVGVFGSVFSTGSFVFERGHTAQQYLALAGGPTRGADRDSIFMIRANGSVVSARQNASFWHSSNEFGETIVEPGDTIFVPEELNKTTFVQGAKDWTQILYQFGLGLAGIKSLGL